MLAHPGAMHVKYIMHEQYIEKYIMHQPCKFQPQKGRWNVCT